MEKERIIFPLVDSSYDNEEILGCIATLLSGDLTMGAQVLAFEEALAQWLGAKYCVMVNSGSSANLLALAALTNPVRRRRLAAGAKVAVPAVCWSTSLWPVIHAGLIPVLVDVDPNTLNLSMASLETALVRHRIEAVMMVHVLGNSTDLPALLDCVRANDLILVEDTCESLGSRFGDACLGTLGEFGTYSFYFSHHMTTIEGGMIATESNEDNDLLRCLRTHGWSREQTNRAELETRHQAIDPRFLFINTGFNVRPMEIQAAFGLHQIRRLDQMNAHRRENVLRIREAFRAHQDWRGQLRFPEPTPELDPCWFGFPFLVDEAVDFDRRKFIANLLRRGIDTRPIVSGNMALQPAVQLFPVDLGLGPFLGAQRVHDRGLFIGCHSKRLTDARIELLVRTVLETLAESR